VLHCTTPIFSLRLKGRFTVAHGGNHSRTQRGAGWPLPEQHSGSSRERKAQTSKQRSAPWVCSCSSARSPAEHGPPKQVRIRRHRAASEHRMQENTGRKRTQVAGEQWWQSTGCNAVVRGTEWPLSRGRAALARYSRLEATPARLLLGAATGSELCWPETSSQAEARATGAALSALS